MFCPKCGNECLETANFCGVCGYKLTETLSDEKLQDNEQIQDEKEAVENNTDSTHGNSDSKTSFAKDNDASVPERPRKKHRGLIIFFILTAIILTIAIGSFFGSSVFDLIDSNQIRVLSLRIKLSPKVLTETKRLSSYGFDDSGKYVFLTGTYNVVQYVVLKDLGTDMLRFLLEKGADVNYVSDDGETALSIAVGGDKQKYVEVLLAFNADPEVTEKVSVGGESTEIPLLMHAAVLDNNQAMVELLIKAGANVNREDDFGFTSLERCLMQNRDLPMITLLIDNGADLQHFSSNGETPLMIAISEDCDFEIIKLLIDSNPSIINVENNGLNVIQQAIICDSSLEIIKYIVSNGADLHAETKYGNTLMDLAEYYASEEVQEYVELAIEAYDFMKTHIIDPASRIPGKDRQEIAEKYVLFYDDFDIDLVFITADASVQSIELKSYTEDMLDKYGDSSWSQVVVTLTPSRIYSVWNTNTGITEDDSQTIIDTVGPFYWREEAVSAAYEFERIVRKILEEKNMK